MTTNSYLQMWEDFAKQGSYGYKSSKYNLNNIVGLTGRAREYEIIRLLELKKTDVFLDVGCASGRQVFVAAPGVKQAIGIDVGKEFIDTAKNFAVSHHIDNVEFIHTEGTIPFPDNYFDKLMCSEVLEHVDDPHDLLVEIKRVLKERGAVVFTVPNWNSRGTLWKRLKNGFQPFPFTPLTDFSMEGIKKHGDAHVRQFTYKTFRELIEKEGFVVDYVGGASFIDFPHSGPVIEITNQFRLVQQVTFFLEKCLARLSRSLGRHIILKARRR